MRRFKSLLEGVERKKNSRIILALDVVAENRKKIFSRSIQILDEVCEYICALKINHHLVLPLGLFNGVKRILDRAKDLELPAIMDCKANDVGSTNRIIAENYFKAGFDAIIANPFVGWEDGLQPIFEVAEKMGRGVILLVYMSHRSAWEGYGQKIYDENTGSIKPQYVVFAEKALAWKADGAIVGATYPEKISEVHAILGKDVPIYSPGVGVQGGDLERAILAGAHYLIIGRSIVEVKEPAEAARRLRDASNKIINSIDCGMNLGS
ncbi:MAG: orotidine 5'-phosphate decarboxylase [Candidatus Bathyarchaeota archaeon]|nr:orotidine 5'-phosphate decarboxylase [Candidatus Bathyarchaeota archaeon]